MNAKLPVRRTAAKTGTRHLTGRSPSNDGSISPAMQKFRELYPQQTALELALRTGADIKHCERCLKGECGLGAGYQQALLRSDVGREILIVLMGDARPKWWVGFSRHLALADLARKQAQTQKAIEAMQRELAE